ncbi:Sodium/glutamate symporter [Candidatus Filomicrobium marinum]|uniref:Sodium/glutamate symporter n=2 Tax=Filomicrobium TaxID=119044 RepID=A0A0D6JAL9_9HYPH|nr:MULTISPECIES: sodium/glutamate symporter [Filomicrobium]CFW97795.1 Sodium/glutamate symporter [Candidatus Filomicrobium marinum]CPR14777.1 Sodium/glutamate symporter [Candidatus Filomicrobium marinum]SDO75640.1 glutamate:Na+ symporter, ESS family [Filomicrobium insigne]
MQIPAFPAVTCGIIVFFVGAFLTRRVPFLRDYNIPEPVAGGLMAALVTWVYFLVSGTQITFDLIVRDQLLVIFFATLGLNARFSDLLAGGRLLGILLALTVIFILIQNAVGLLGTNLFGLPASVSVLVGSASLIGGHGTAIAWGPTITSVSGFAAAEEIGIAAATLGLVAAALIGGPLAKHLIERDKLEASDNDTLIVGLPDEDPGPGEPDIDHIELMRAILAAHVAVLLGYLANQWISDLGLTLPLFVPCMLVAIVMANTIPYLFPTLPWPGGTRALAVVSDYCLSVFLAMSLMSMQLWTLAGLGGPLVGILILQVVAAMVFILFVVYRFTGADYTAAVLSAGFAGFSLGATPTAIANMSSVTKHHGPAPLALIILPLVSAFFVDLVNAMVIQFFAGL